MPETHWKYGYPMAIGLMVAVSVALYAIFKCRGWRSPCPGAATYAPYRDKGAACRRTRLKRAAAAALPLPRHEPRGSLQPGAAGPGKDFPDAR